MKSSISPVKQPVSKEALAWAEYLYDEFTRHKHKQLLDRPKRKKIDAQRGKK